MNRGTVQGNAQAFGLRFEQVSTERLKACEDQHNKLVGLIEAELAQQAPSARFHINGKLRGLVNIARERVKVLMAFIAQFRQTYGHDRDADRIQRLLQLMERIDAVANEAEGLTNDNVPVNAASPSPRRRADGFGVPWEPTPMYPSARQPGAQGQWSLYGSPDARGSQRSDGHARGFLRDGLSPAGRQTAGNLSPPIHDGHGRPPPVFGTPPRKITRSPELMMDGDDAAHAYRLDEPAVGGGGRRAGAPARDFDDQPVGGNAARRGTAIARDEEPAPARAPPAAVAAKKRAAPAPRMGIKERLAARAAAQKQPPSEPAAPPEPAARPRSPPIRGAAVHGEEPRVVHDEDDVAVASGPSAPPQRPPPARGAAMGRFDDERPAGPPARAGGARAMPPPRGAAPSRFDEDDAPIAGPQHSRPGSHPGSQRPSPPAASSRGPTQLRTALDVELAESEARFAIVLQAQQAFATKIAFETFNDGAHFLRRMAYERGERGPHRGNSARDAYADPPRERAPRRTVQASVGELNWWQAVIMVPPALLVLGLALLVVRNAFFQMIGAA